MSVVSPHPTSPPSSKQKAKLLLKMANAVEDSSARRRQRLQDKKNLSGETVDRLLEDLELEASWDQRTPMTASTGALSPDSLQSRRSQIWPSSPGSPVNAQHYLRLYTAIICYRENADLRYQLLELRHLDLSQSFLELENRYRHLESEQEAWKKSCEVLQQAAADIDSSRRSHDGDMDSTRKRHGDATPGVASRSGWAKSAVPMMQEEIKQLSSQRNQLLQANMELRKQLKQMQIQMQTPKGEDSRAATCRRCHPELLAGRQQLAEDLFTNIVQHFHSTLTASEHTQKSTKSEDSKQEDQPTPQEEEETLSQSLSENDPDDLPLDSTREEDQHEGKMKLLGMHFTRTRQQSGSQPHANDVLVAQKNQKSIIWSPPLQSLDRSTSVNSIDPKPLNTTAKVQMVPTINSILPMQQQQQQPKRPSKVLDIQVSPRTNIPQGSPTEVLQNSFHDFDPSNQNPGQQVAPKKATKPEVLKVPPVTPDITVTRGQHQESPHTDIGWLGMLDDFGRSVSNLLTNGTKVGTANTDNNSTHSGSTIHTSNAGGQQRKSIAVIPSPHQPSLQPRVNQQRRPQRHSTPAPASSNARHLEHHLQGTAPQNRPHQSPIRLRARHLEFAAPGNPSKLKQKGNATPQQQPHPSTDIMRGPQPGTGNPPQTRQNGNPRPRQQQQQHNSTDMLRGPQTGIRRPQTFDAKDVPAMPSRSHLSSGWNSAQPASGGVPQRNSVNPRGDRPAAVGGPQGIIGALFGTSSLSASQGSNGVQSPRRGNGTLSASHESNGVQSPRRGNGSLSASHESNGVQSQRRHGQQQQPPLTRGRSAEQQKAERPESYFERIKKTLQQEI